MSKNVELVSHYIAAAVTYKHLKKHHQYWFGIGIGFPLLIILGFVLKTYILPSSFKPPATSPAPAVSVPPPAPPKTAKQIQTDQLTALVNDYVNREQADFHIYIKNLSNGVSVSHDDTTSVPSGSIYKLFVAHEAYRRQEAGQFNFYSPAGATGYSVADCVVRMVRNSTNVCGEAVRAMLGAAQISRDAQRQGYKGVDYVSHEAAHVAPRDIGLLYEHLLMGKTLNPAHRAEFIKSLKDQEWTFRLPEGLPREPVRARRADWGNKTGDVYDYANDSAIVWGEKATYVIVIMANNWPQIFPYSSYSIRHFSGQVYNLLNGTDYPLPY